MVDNLNDIYQVGTFCQVTEMRNVDDKLRIVLLGHRRIKITDVAKITDPTKAEKEENEEKVEEEPSTDNDLILQVTL